LLAVVLGDDLEFLLDRSHPALGQACVGGPLGADKLDFVGVEEGGGGGLLQLGGKLCESLRGLGGGEVVVVGGGGGGVVVVEEDVEVVVVALDGGGALHEVGS